MANENLHKAKEAKNDEFYTQLNDVDVYKRQVFAYRKMESCIENQSYRRSFGIIKINPAYTSQIGKILYMRKLGISIHEAASYVIGLKGMGLSLIHILKGK